MDSRGKEKRDESAALATGGVMAPARIHFNRCAVGAAVAVQALGGRRGESSSEGLKYLRSMGTATSSTPQAQAKRMASKGMLDHPHRMDICFLGTGAMKPTMGRGCSSLLLRTSGDVWMFDCGEGTQRHLDITWGWNNLTKIFITHMHGDHVLGLPELCSQYRTSSRSVVSIFLET